MNIIKSKIKNKVFLLFGYIISVIFLTTALFSCEESSVGQQPIDQIAPPAPTNAIVENLNGGAVISYDIPELVDLLYVKATYKINNKIRESKSSIYSNSLEVSGFGDTKEYKVELRSVDRSRNESEPLIVTINPLTPPVILIRESFNMQTAFGGVQLTWENESRADIIISFMAADSTGTLVDAEDVYTSTLEGKFSLRGFDTSKREFAVYVRDRWGNYSDTLFLITSPYFEEEIDKSKFKGVQLPGDAARTQYGIENIWDGTTSKFWHTQWQSGGETMPIKCTIDMGVIAKLSRYKLWQRPGFFYTHNNPKKWELWGSTDPSSNGLLDESWILLGEFDSFKPSGDGPVTNEDTEYANNGEEFELPIDIPPVRYIRFVMYENWSSGNIAQISEMTFWGESKQ